MNTPTYRWTFGSLSLFKPNIQTSYPYQLNFNNGWIFPLSQENQTEFPSEAVVGELDPPACTKT